MSQATASAFDQADAPDASSALLPPDFEAWPKPARWLLRTIVSLPSWVAHGYALCTDEQLAEWRQCDERTIRRMRREANARGEIARVFVKRGATLPDGERARRGLFILVDGPARRARLAGAVLEEHAEPPPLPPPVEELGAETVQPERTNDPHQQDNLTGDRSLDPSDHRNINAAVEELAAPVVNEPRSERSISFHSSGSTGESKSTEGGADDERAALAIATHYARATGKAWRIVFPAVLAHVLGFVREMVGNEANKIDRACRVIDRVAGEAARRGEAPPTLRYVFHERIFWSRLEELARPPRELAPRSSAPSTSSPPAPPAERTPPKQLARTTAPIDEDAETIRALCRESFGLPLVDDARTARAA